MSEKLCISAICMHWHSTEWRASILHVSDVRNKNKQFNLLTCYARDLLIFKDLSVSGRLCTQRADDPLSSLRVCTVIMLRELCIDSWPNTQPGQFYGSFRLLGLIRMRQVVLSLWLRHLASCIDPLLPFSIRPGAWAVVHEQISLAC
jgi:hypothetical protein